MTDSVPFSDNLREFIKSCNWKFAKTMSEWPHEYIVRKNVNEDLFIQMVIHIRENGYVGKFYKKDIIYFEDNGLIYWTMGNPINETVVINRTKKENSYKNHLKNGTLPEDREKTGKLEGSS